MLGLTWIGGLQHGERIATCALRTCLLVAYCVSFVEELRQLSYTEGRTTWLLLLQDCPCLIWVGC